MSRGTGKNNPTMALSKVGVPLMIPQKVDTRAGRENKQTAQSALFFLHALFLSDQYCSSQDVSTCLQPSVVQVSALCLRAQALLDSVGTVQSLCVLRRLFSERKSLYVHTHTDTLRISHTPWFYGLRRDTLLTHKHGAVALLPWTMMNSASLTLHVTFSVSVLDPLTVFGTHEHERATEGRRLGSCPRYFV